MTSNVNNNNSSAKIHFQTAEQSECVKKKEPKPIDGIVMRTLHNIVKLQIERYAFTPFSEPRLTAAFGEDVYYFNKYDWGVMVYRANKSPVLQRFNHNRSSWPVTCLAVDVNFFYLAHENCEVSCWKKNGEFDHLLRHRHEVISRIICVNDLLISAMLTGDPVKQPKPTDSTVVIWDPLKKTSQFSNFYEDTDPDFLASDGTTLFCPYEEKIAVIDIKTASLSATIDLPQTPQKMEITASKSFQGGVAFGTHNGGIAVLKSPFNGREDKIILWGHNEPILAIEVDYPFMFTSSQSSLIFWSLIDREQIGTIDTDNGIKFIQKRDNDFFLHDGKKNFSITIDKSLYTSAMERKKNVTVGN